jgi:hypothetical protein
MFTGTIYKMESGTSEGGLMNIAAFLAITEIIYKYSFTGIFLLWYIQNTENKNNLEDDYYE